MTKTKGLLLLFLVAPAVVSAYQPAAPANGATTTAKTTQDWLGPARKAAFSATLSTALLLPHPAQATSSAAAQISLNQIPPTSINLDIGDLPVVGGLLSGTYQKVPAKSLSGKPSVTISSPKDKVKAIQNVVGGGHLEFDVSGVLSTHLDVDVAADEAGVAKVRVASNLIPPLPFKNAASGKIAASGGKESDWSVVTNMGNGESYYFNSKSGETQYNKPSSM